MIDITRLKHLYRKGRLSEGELIEYSGLRQAEFLEAKERLLQEGKTNVHVVKGDDDDIIGWTFTSELHPPAVKQ